MAVAAARARTPHVVEGEGAVVGKLDRTVAITSLDLGLTTTVILTDTHPLEPVGGGGRKANLPVHGGPLVFLQRPQFSGDDYDCSPTR